jgi:hypothetical protein
LEYIGQLIRHSGKPHLSLHFAIVTVPENIRKQKKLMSANCWNWLGGCWLTLLQFDLALYTYSSTYDLY